MRTAYPKVSLRQICASIEYGYTASATSEPVGPRFLRITDIVPDRIDWTAVPFCEIDRKKLEKHRLRTGDIVIARTGATTGWAKFIKQPPEAVYASYLVRIRPAPTVDAQFVGAVVESQIYKDFIQQHMGGAAQPNANAQILTSFEIPLPALSVQRRIAGILSAYDELMENCHRRIRVLEEIARALYREWFVHFRFPGHEKVPRVDSLLGPIPKGWEVKKLGDILQLNYGKALKQEQRRGGAVPVFGSSGIVGYHDDSLATGPGIIVGRKGNVGSVFWSDEDFFVIDTAYYVTALLPLRFLFYDLGTKNFINNDAAVPGLSRRQAYALETLVPPADLLSRFCRLADAFERQASTLRRQIENLRRTRDLLLPRLLSGQITLEAVEPAEAAA